VDAPGADRSHGLSASKVGANRTTKELQMLYWAAVFLVIALVATVLGLGGIAGLSANIAWVLFIVGVILAVVFAIKRGR
jgi:uncharacterized membrane protein YtjA (UPF0391 family)